MNWQQSARSIAKNLKTLVTVSRFEAAIAFISMLIAGFGAWQAYKSAADSKEDADKAERQLRAAESMAEKAKEQVAAVERQAQAAERSMVEARELVTATRLLRDEMARSVEVAKDQLNQMKADNYAVRRPRIRISNTNVGSRTVGQKLFSVTSYINSGTEDPVQIRMGSAVGPVEANRQIPRSIIPACETLAVNHDNWMGGHFWKESEKVWSAKDEKDFVGGVINIYIYGRMCYTDSLGMEHKIDYCLVHFGSGGSRQCKFIDS